MVTANLDKSQFSAGELDPALHARKDLARNQAGLKACENYVVMVEGGLTRTPGTAYVAPLKDEMQRGKLVPFEFSVDDNYMLAFNAGVMRVHRNGGIVIDGDDPPNPYELAVPFAEADLPNLRWAGSGDVIFIAWAKQPKVLTRKDHDDWTIEDYGNLRGPVEPQNTDTAKTISASAATGSVTLTASSDLFQAAHVGSIWRLDEANLANVPTWKGNEKPLAVGDLRRNGGKVYSVAAITGTDVGEDAGPNPPTHEEGQVLAGKGNVVWQYEHSGYGHVKITAFIDATHVTATVIGQLPGDVVAPNATYRWYEAAWSDVKGWPKQVRLADNSLVWTDRNRFWRSKVTDLYDFELSADDDSAIATRIFSQDGTLVDIQWVLNAGILVLGTRSGEWIVRGGSDPFEPLTLANIRMIPDTNEGSAPHIPQPVDGGAVFIGRSRDRLHFAKFDRVSEDIDMSELTLYARNILRGVATVLAYQRDPHRVVWIATAAGELISVTFRPDQEVIGWARHPDDNGSVEDMAVIASADASYSQLWMIVRRSIDGQTRRYIETMAPFFRPANFNTPDASGAWMVRSGLRYQGAPATTISGLDHLRGEEVAIMTDGRQHVRRTVSADGEITLQYAAGDVLVGLPINGRIRTLSAETTIDGSGTKGTKKKADSVLLERLFGAGGTLSANDGPPEPLLLSGHIMPAGAWPLETISRSVTTESPIEDFMEIELVNDTVYPDTILGLSPHVNFVEDRG
ncbi:hypothetical protein [Bosea minatitlanensis]|uniref:Uncharacterized protein n=1 Tax=Bosea minatitlanensis TaxID=128782 RepID=A0ABW0F0V6_9HYPH|nr:hypothetical protein [Bosea minatitlanensis]MCT4495399.1 hypothetical protein [Bosea minatitlanensis]